MTDRATRALAELWVSMASMFGNRWASQYGSAPQGVDLLVWGEAIKGLTPAQVREGIGHVLALGEDWPPPAPAFRRLCLGVPSLAQVRLELRPGAPEVSAFTREVWRVLDSHLYRHAEQHVANAMLREAYELALAAVMRGVKLPEVMAAVAAEQVAKRRKPAAPEVVREVVDRLTDLLGAAA